MTRDSIEAIVVGTSAGGFAALKALLPQLPANYPLPIVIVVHVVRDQPSMLVELLRNNCQLTVKEAEDKECLAPGVVYFAPPDYHLLVETNKSLSLSSDEPVLYSRPSIDVLFETAADAYREKLLGIVLTGANSDGAKGLKRIEQVGGIAIVQDPDEAEVSLMPWSAINACQSPRILNLQSIMDVLTGEIIA